jgi:hypothetical protein
MYTIREYISSKKNIKKTKINDKIVVFLRLEIIIIVGQRLHNSPLVQFFLNINT